MSEIHSVGAQLRCRQPRHPSAGLERRLFGTPARFMSKMVWAVGWLVPAAAGALPTLSVFISPNDFPGRSFRHEPITTMTLSHQPFQASAPGGEQQRLSNLLSGLFDQNNHDVFTSSITTFARRRVN